MSDLPIEKQFTHANFLRQIESIDLDTAKKLLEELHMLYLAQQAVITKIARNDFWRQ
jgi:DNA-directed RNA polymerase subunit F